MVNTGEGQEDSRSLVRKQSVLFYTLRRFNKSQRRGGPGLECPWLPAAWEACERFDREEDDRHAALRHAAAAVVDQPHASASVALRRVSAGSMVFLSVPD